ncbi:hypothetical protein Tco_0543014 [Tanacetum coccineum]
MPPKRTAVTTTLMTDAQIKALISNYGKVFAEHCRTQQTEAKNGNDSHNSGSDGRRLMPIARECTYIDFLKCQPLNFKKTLKKMMTDKYCPRGKIKKLEIELWNLKVKESDEVEKYVGGLPDMIQGSVMIRTLAERQAEKKKKFEDTSRYNQSQQQPFKRHNVARAFIAGPGEKKPYRGSKPLCPKCNYHHDGQCAPKCANCKRTGHLTRDYRSQPATANNQRAQGANQRILTCFECRAPGYFKSNCLKLKNNNQGNQAGNGNVVARSYVVGTIGTNSNSSVVTGFVPLNNRYATLFI